MENGQAVDTLVNDEEQVEIWENGQDLSQSPLPLSSFALEQYLDPSAEALQVESYTPVYEMGDMQGYSLSNLAGIAVLGCCAGFAISIGVCLLAYAISAVMSAFRGVTTE